MATKSLSNGTLSLRFMQNALRAKQQEQVEAAQAKVVDESQWEVPSDVKEAWGIGSDSQRGQAVVYESSYLPFIFSSHPEASTSIATSTGDQVKPVGRRTFNAKGKEVTAEVAVSVEAPQEAADVEVRDWSRGSKRPSTISGSTATVFKERKFVKKSSLMAKDSSKSARSLVFDMANPGTGLRARHLSRPDSQSTTTSTPASATTFLKPAGVDEPTAKLRHEEALDGARRKHSQGKPKRRRDGEGEASFDHDRLREGDGDGSTQKRRKKKKAAIELVG